MNILTNLFIKKDKEIIKEEIIQPILKISDELLGQDFILTRGDDAIGKISFINRKWIFMSRTSHKFTRSELNTIAIRLAKLESNYPNGITVKFGESDEK